MMGRMYSSVVGQYRLFLHTETTEGFHVTFERDRYANRLKAHTCPSNPGSARIVGSSCGTSRKWRLIGCPVASDRSGSSPGTPTIRFAVTRRRVTAAVLLPAFGPNAVPVS